MRAPTPTRSSTSAESTDRIIEQRLEASENQLAHTERRSPAARAAQSEPWQDITVANSTLPPQCAQRHHPGAVWRLSS